MAKVKTSFFCSNCGAQSPKWVGKCSQCGEWNTYVEEVIQREDEKKFTWKSSNGKTSAPPTPKLLADIREEDAVRIDTSDKELNRVLGGGLVAGSVVLIGGEPGIGKSTLTLQIAMKMKNTKILFISGEESAGQLNMRANRIGKMNKDLFILTETNTQNIFSQIENMKPALVIVDSIQTLYSNNIESTPGSISQIRECAGEFQRFAKETNTPVILIGHITKDGMLAGPKILEHMVDTVLQFEGDRNHIYRILRTTKNRFGSTAEMGIYEMKNDGLREVNNPSEILISQRDDHLSGIAIAAAVEGLRPMLIETQALVSCAVYGTPQRSSTGFDLRRLNMLLAVLEKRMGMHFGTQDVFLNIAGGIRVEDPAIDLAIVGALISSFQDLPLKNNVCFAGEVGLSGEIRAVTRIDQRIAEADKLGFEKIFISTYAEKGLDKSQFKIEVKTVSKVQELVTLLF